MPLTVKTSLMIVILSLKLSLYTRVLSNSLAFLHIAMHNFILIHMADLILLVQYLYSKCSTGKLLRWIDLPSLSKTLSSCATIFFNCDALPLYHLIILSHITCRLFQIHVNPQDKSYLIVGLALSLFQPEAHWIIIRKGIRKVLTLRTVLLIRTAHQFNIFKHLAKFDVDIRASPGK